MKKTTLLTTLILLISVVGNAQTTIWESESEDYASWIFEDLDGDSDSWFYDPSGDSLGFDFTGTVFASSASDTAPNNILKSPTFLIDATLTTLNFQMRIGNAIGAPFKDETYAVYVYDVATNPTGDYTTETPILSTSAIADSSSEIVTAIIPSSFAGKTVGLIIRHFNINNGTLGNILIVDDFKVDSPITLSTQNNNIENLSFFPNPVSDIVTLQTPANLNTVIVYNQLGQRLLTFNKSELTSKKLDLSSLQTGIYILDVKDVNNNTGKIKVIVE